MSYEDLPMGPELLNVSNCPHCGVASPYLPQVWQPKSPLVPTNGGRSIVWAVYACRSCGSLITAKAHPGYETFNAPIQKIFPEVWQVPELVPEKVRGYLEQAHRTLHAPDASVVMSASSIDAMLKDHGLTDGTLYRRIDQAVTDGLITQKMAEWAHRVRLDSNNPRHADENVPNMSAEDARRAFDYANALTEYLYLLPSRMPPAET